MSIPQDWSNPPSLSELQSDFMDSKSYHDSAMVRIHEYRQLRDATGIYAAPDRGKGFSKVQPKLIRKHAEWRYASLSEPFLQDDDIFMLSPRTFADKQAAEQNQLLLNYQWNNVLNRTHFIDSLVRRDTDEGTGFIRVGWISQEESYTKEVPMYDFYPAQTQEQVQELMRFAEYQQSNPYGYDKVIPSHFIQALQLTQTQGIPVYPTLAGVQQVETTRLVKNQPEVEVCVTDNLYIDPSCNGDLDNARFAIYSFETSKSELRADSRYFDIDKIQATHEGSILDSPDHTIVGDEAFQFKDDARARIVAYEYWGEWDVDGSGITKAFVATWVNNVLIRLEPNPYPDQKIPFVGVTYLPIADSVYGHSDAELLRDNQAIVGAVTRGAIDVMARSANGQRGIRQDALDEVNKKRYEDGKDYEFNPMVDPRQAVIDHVYPELPNSVAFMLNNQETDANNMTGVRPFGPTASSPSNTTATSARGMLDAATKRENGILRRMTDAIKQVAIKIIAMNAEFLSDEEIIRVTDEEFVAIRREDLKGNFDVKVDISTAEENDAKAQELAFMLQTMDSSMPLEMSQTVLGEIAKLRNMPELSRRILDYKPEPDPIQQQIQQLELQKLQLENAELQAKVGKIHTDAQLNIAKAQESGAKASNLQSDTDKKDLDFLNEQSGLNHAREVQQDQSQAKGNMALEILKAELEKQKPQVSK